ncbi:hypothetical protein GE061_009289 [Apolygus lucorum]|uniref:DNA helicase Pif1-like 2B domain-containing protein n=1 Tax=Apolygus lucorum TaxID=248454 RepID=A0A8S9Y2H4_APOLU|nr:hypothetical protein GE061_009289 [Apolygus lucorum]
MVILSQRLVSAAECAFRLCHLPLKMSSVKVVFVNSCKPNERFRLLRFETDDTSVFNNIFDRYIKRPDYLEELSLAEFAVRYETMAGSEWSEEDGDHELRNYEDTIPQRFITLRDRTRMRIRHKPAVLRTRYYTLNSDREGFYYSLIVCHVPFRDENDLLFEGETAEACFLRRQNELRPLLGNLSAEQFAHMEAVIQQALAQAVALNTGRLPNDAEPSNFQIPNLAPDEEILMNDPNDFCEEPIPTSVMPDDVYLTSVQHLNIQQKNLFRNVSAAIEKDIAKQDNQLLLFITGGAGSGKSFLLKLIVEHIKRCYGPTVDILLKPQFVEVGSLTGVAAQLAKSQRMYVVNAIDESREAATYGKRPPSNVIPVDVNNCGGLLHTISISEGSRVMLRRNISISNGLVNGAMGIVAKFRWPALRRDQIENGELPDAVLIRMDDDTIGNNIKDPEGLVAIQPVTATFQANKGYGDVERRMIPLILSWAVTVHKLQGTTLERAVIDLGNKLFAKGQAYVALSRVRTLNGIAISDLSPHKLLTAPHDSKSLAEMERLRDLQQQ